MAKRYTSTITLRCGKQHTCSGCGGVYSYLFVRKVSGTSGTAEGAQQNARKAADKALARSVDLQACPTCGLYQPDMIGQQRSKAHLTIFFIALVVLGVVLILRASYALPANTAAWVLACACAAAALAHGFSDFKDLNRDPEANRRRTADRITAGTVQAHSAGRIGPPAAECMRPPRVLFHQLALLLLGVAVLLAASPEVLRSIRGWPLSPDAYPPVVGPGDTTRIYMNDKISSVLGYWRGFPKVALQMPGAQDIEASAKTNQNNWGDTIHAKSTEKDNSSTPWVEVEVPSDPALAGKTVECAIQLGIEYPKASGSSAFSVEQDVLRRSVTLHLASQGAGANYNSVWWVGALGATALVLFSGLVLFGASRGLQKKANPTQILA
jgi:hypothetical protein